jgi:hypothetical protein
MLKTAASKARFLRDPVEFQKHQLCRRLRPHARSAGLKRGIGFALQEIISLPREILKIRQNGGDRCAHYCA